MAGAQDVPFGSFAPTPFEPDPPVDTIKWLRSMQPGLAQEIAKRLKSMPPIGQQAARFIAPGLYDYATEPAPTYEQRLNAAGGSGGGPNAQLVPNAAGKVPDIENTQRPGHALADVFNLATTVLPSGAPAKAAIMAAPFAFGRRGAGLLETAAPKGIRAYHVSPHDFDRFDMSKIGIGQGAQSYGHGIYVAENPKVSGGPGSEYYKEFSTRFPRDPVEATALDYLRSHNYDRVAAASSIRHFMENGANKSNKTLMENLQNAEQRLAGGEQVGPRTYEVNINARPEQFLDWDKPLSGQIPQVQEGVKGAMGIDYHGKFDPQKADRLWNEFQHAGADSAVRRGFIASDDKLVSNRLRDAGIPGIKYLDQGSRPMLNVTKEELIASNKRFRLAAEGRGDLKGAAEYQARIDELEKSAGPTHNYVLFDDKLIDILRKYAIPGMLAPPAAAAVTQAPFGSFAPQ